MPSFAFSFHPQVGERMTLLRLDPELKLLEQRGERRRPEASYREAFRPGTKVPFATAVCVKGQQHLL